MSEINLEFDVMNYDDSCVIIIPKNRYDDVYILIQQLNSQLQVVDSCIFKENGDTIFKFSQDGLFKIYRFISKDGDLKTAKNKYNEYFFSLKNQVKCYLKQSEIYLNKNCYDNIDKHIVDQGIILELIQYLLDLGKLEEAQRLIEQNSQNCNCNE